MTEFTASNASCTFERCPRDVHALGLCSGHYAQQRSGRVLAPLRHKRTASDDPAESFWARVDRSGDCWMWTGATSEGYGMVWWEGRKRGAHVIAFELAHGDLTRGIVPDHRCRNRLCVNPGHLRHATAKQNAENRGLQGNNSSGYRGVRKDRRGKRWVAYARHFGVEHRVPGSFDSPQEANVAAIRLRSVLFTHAEDAS